MAAWPADGSHAARPRLPAALAGAATASYRLLPSITIKPGVEIVGEQAERFAKCFAPGVIELVDNGKGTSGAVRRADACWHMLTGKTRCRSPPRLRRARTQARRRRWWPTRGTTPSAGRSCGTRTWPSSSGSGASATISSVRAHSQRRCAKALGGSLTHRAPPPALCRPTVFVESTGVLPAPVLLREAVKHLMAKVQAVKAGLAELLTPADEMAVDA